MSWSQNRFDLLRKANLPIQRKPKTTRSQKPTLVNKGHFSYAQDRSQQHRQKRAAGATDDRGQRDNREHDHDDQSWTLVGRKQKEPPATPSNLQTSKWTINSNFTGSAPTQSRQEGHCIGGQSKNHQQNLPSKKAGFFAAASAPKRKAKRGGQDSAKEKPDHLLQAMRLKQATGGKIELPAVEEILAKVGGDYDKALKLIRSRKSASPAACSSPIRPPKQSLAQQLKNMVNRVQTHRGVRERRQVNLPSQKPKVHSHTSSTRNSIEKAVCVFCPADRVGLIIGRNGCVLKQLRKVTSTCIEFDSRTSEFIVSNAAEADLKKACSMIEDLAYDVEGGVSVTREQKLCFPTRPQKGQVGATSFKKIRMRKKKRRNKKCRANFSESTSSDGSQDSSSSRPRVNHKISVKKLLKEGGWSLLRQSHHAVYCRDIGFGRQQKYTMAVTPSDYRAEKSQRLVLRELDELAKAWKESKGTLSE